MKKRLFVVFSVLAMAFLFVACGEKKELANIALDNGVQVTILDKYNAEDFAMDTSKSAELDAIEAYYKDKLAEDAWLFETSDSQISWCWGNPDAGDGIHDLVLAKSLETGTYELDLNYDMRTDITEGVDTADSRDIVRFMLSFVTSEPTLIEEQIYMDLFVNEQASIPMAEGWFNVADCDLQWNAENGYGLTVVIKEHVK